MIRYKRKENTMTNQDIINIINARRRNGEVKGNFSIEEGFKKYDIHYDCQRISYEVWSGKTRPDFSMTCHC